MIRVFISLPMSGRPDEDVRKERDELMEKFKEMYHGNEKVMFTDNLDCEDPSELYSEDFIVTKNLFYLGAAIANLGTCKAAIFSPNWESARGCKIEREVCELYNIDIIDA